ncbi:MAG: ATP-dependent RNA helicase DbpA [Thiotrichales bacterium]|nr:ATP-dependent RNA helicase DbpA [Thiotrichales bacterium]
MLCVYSGWDSVANANAQPKVFLVTATPTFTELGLAPALLNSLQHLNYQHMTPIQAQSLPWILQGNDLIAQAKTGSGKTAAFSLGLLQRLQSSRSKPQALVLCPTRELAEQVAQEIRRLASSIENVKVLTLCGGVPFRGQASSLEYGAQILVGTPGRIEEHLNRETLDLSQLTQLVLDEADRMLEMGFEAALNAIIERTPKNRQTLLFSATFPKAIEQLAAHILRQPKSVKVDAVHDEHQLRQHFYPIEEESERIEVVKRLLMAHQPRSTVVFYNTKIEAQQLANQLAREGFSVLALHGDLEQRERDQALLQFANRSATILVATDVAARGLDIAAVEVVINAQLAHDPEVHLHRVGRTGRAGKQGFACSLYSPRDQFKLQQLREQLNLDITAEALPEKNVLFQPIIKAPMVTLQIEGGKKQKIRAGDILGALTGEGGIAGDQVGKIQITDIRAFVAVTKAASKQALQKLGQGTLKGKRIRVRFL